MFGRRFLPMDRSLPPEQAADAEFRSEERAGLGRPTSTAATSAAVGIDGAAPIRCTQIEAAALAKPSASRRTHLASRAASAPTKQSPAPVVSTAVTAGRPRRSLSPSTSATAPRLPSVTQMVWPDRAELSRRIDEARGLVACREARSSRSKASSVSLSTRISTSRAVRLEGARRRRIEDRRRAGSAGATEERGDRRQRNLELADRDVALCERAVATSSTLTSPLAPGMTTMVLSAFATVMIAVPVCVSAVARTRPRSTPCAPRKVFSCWPNESLPTRPISVVARQACRRNRLVRALAARKIEHAVSRHGLADRAGAARPSPPHPC